MAVCPDESQDDIISLRKRSSRKMDKNCKICKMGKSVLLVSVLHGDITKNGIKCWMCRKRWFDHYMLIDTIPYCIDCGEIMLAKLGFKEQEEEELECL